MRYIAIIGAATMILASGRAQAQNAPYETNSLMQSCGPQHSWLGSLRNQLDRTYSQQFSASSGAPGLYTPGSAMGLGPDTGFVWAQHRDGGYYEASGKLPNVVINGSDLWRYGGRLNDGRRIPRGPLATNFAGHLLY